MPGLTNDGRALDAVSDAVDDVNVLRGKLWQTQSEVEATKDKASFRQYDNACERVKSFYKEQHEKQTVAYNIKARVDFKSRKRARMGVWQAMEMLNTLVDDSDPDTELSQIEHLLQTAEAIRRDGKPEWMQVTGLIHDLGKLLLFFGSEGQWDVVGGNPDYHDAVYSTKYGIYEPNCGLDNVMMSWGHDEYLYHVVKDQSTLPYEGLAMIRYHSFYPWHRENAYMHLTNAKDMVALDAVRAFNPYDLYSKSNTPCDVEKLRPYYEGLIAKFFPPEIDCHVDNTHYVPEVVSCNFVLSADQIRLDRLLHLLHLLPPSAWSRLTMIEAAPESALPYPPVHKDKKFVVLSDWDGTITTYDSNDYLTDNLGYGREKRRAGNLEVLDGKITFRDAFRGMLESVVENGHTLEHCKQVLKQMLVTPTFYLTPMRCYLVLTTVICSDIKLDPGFRDFYRYCKSMDIPVVIVSSGMEPVIRAVLSVQVTPEEAAEIDIISNDVDVHPDGTWSINKFGHDKSQAILPYRALENPPTLFFLGDGVSDLSAARHADVLFVKDTGDGDNDLAVYCKREHIPHILFPKFEAALDVVKGIVGGTKTVEAALADGKAE
ncbi:hypothetical protein V8B97DRAFT_1917168 [Scleroderma yunnanense]